MECVQFLLCQFVAGTRPRIAGNVLHGGKHSPEELENMEQVRVLHRYGIRILQEDVFCSVSHPVGHIAQGTESLPLRLRHLRGVRAVNTGAASHLLINHSPVNGTAKAHVP